MYSAITHLAIGEFVPYADPDIRNLRNHMKNHNDSNPNDRSRTCLRWRIGGSAAGRLVARLRCQFTNGASTNFVNASRSGMILSTTKCPSIY